jgi:tRNA(Ile)-lysidine synthase
MEQIDWKTCANRVGRLVSRSECDQQVLGFLDNLPPGTPVGVACSGGADSILLVLLLQSRIESALKWHLLHFDHGLRGRESTADAQFVSQLAKGLNLPYRSENWEAPKHPSEDMMRRARFSFFHQTLREFGGSVLCLGHQADDVLESMLIRVARGSGSAGLSAPRPFQTVGGGMTHLRPLLRMDRLKIRSILSDANAPWRDDLSNDSDRHLRNRLRKMVIPTWKEIESRDLISGALLARDRLEDDDQALETWLADLLGTGDPEGIKLNLTVLVDRPRALVRRAIDRWARQLPGLSKISRAWVEVLVAVFQRTGSACVGAGSRGKVILEGGVLSFQKIDESDAGWPNLRLPLGSTVILPDGSWVRARMMTLDQGLKNEIRSGKSDPSAEAWLDIGDGRAGAFTVRSWRAGDRYRPLGAAGTVKIGDQFTNRKLPVERRRFLPVFLLGGTEPVWCPELPPAEGSKINEHSIHAVQLTYCWQPTTFYL